MGRVAIDITKYMKVSFVCPSCSGKLTPLEEKSNTVICYCAKCDLYIEYSHAGIVLRSYKKEPIIILTQGGTNGC